MIVILTWIVKEKRSFLSDNCWLELACLVNYCNMIHQAIIEHIIYDNNIILSYESLIEVHHWTITYSYVTQGADCR